MSAFGTKQTFNKEDTVLDRVYNPISFISRMSARYGVETFFITLARHLNQPERNAAIERTLPSGVLAPVLMPP